VSSHSLLLAITVFTPALAGCLLLLSWLQHRKVTALALWGLGFITASVATTLIIVLRGTIPDFWSIIVGNGLLTAAERLNPLGTDGGRVLANCLLDRPDLCAAGSPSHGDGSN
jgi:hypothetical protein